MRARPLYLHVKGKTILVGVAWPHRGKVLLHCTKWRKPQPLEVKAVDELTPAHAPQTIAKYEWGPIIEAPSALEDRPFDLYELLRSPQRA